MAVHVPLSIEAQIEARVLMMSTNNILSPANGKPIIVPSQDIVLGMYYMTRERPFAKGEGKIFGGRIEEVRVAYDHGVVDLQAPITVPHHSGKRVRDDASVARCCPRSCPEEIPFDCINKVLGKKDARRADRRDVTAAAGQKKTVLLADASAHDRLHATRRSAGISISIDDMLIPPEQERSCSTRRTKKSKKIENQYIEGLITDGERYNKVIDIWAQVAEAIASEMMKDISTRRVQGSRGRRADAQGRRRFNSIFMMADSGARGSHAADPSARRYARSDGQAVRRDHRDADHRELPRRSDGSPVLHLDPRCS